MSEEAVAQNTVETPSAGEEPLVPKYRLDQLAAEIRNLRETVQIKDQAIEQFRQQYTPQGRPDPEEEELLSTLEPTQIKALNKLIDKKLDAGRSEVRSAFGALGNRVDEQDFLLKHGKDKSKYLPRIREMRREYAMRQIPLDSEAAYNFIRVEEMDNKASGEPAKAPEQPATKAVKKEETPPPAQATHAKPTESKSLEELEADLDEQIKASGRSF